MNKRRKSKQKNSTAYLEEDFFTFPVPEGYTVNNWVHPHPNVTSPNCSLAHYSINKNTNNNKNKNLSYLLQWRLYCLHQLRSTKRRTLLLSWNTFHPEHRKPPPYLRPLETITGLKCNVCFCPLILGWVSLALSLSHFLSLFLSFLI